MSGLHVHIEVVQWAEIEIDVAKFCAAYSNERESFDGDDDQFVIESIYEIGVEEFLTPGHDDDRYGIRFVDYDDDTEVHPLAAER